MQHLTRLIQAMDKVLGIATPELGNLLGLSSQLLEERALKVPAAKALIRKQVGSLGGTGLGRLCDRTWSRSQMSWVKVLSAGPRGCGQGAAHQNSDAGPLKPCGGGSSSTPSPPQSLTGVRCQLGALHLQIARDEDIQVHMSKTYEAASTLYNRALYVASNGQHNLREQFIVHQQSPVNL